ncbi:primosomal protein N' [soil metagenome]
MSLLAEIVPLTPVEGTFTYRVPHGLVDEVVPGARVLVPFGRRLVTGVVARTDEGDQDGLKDIREVLDARPAVMPELLRLTAWIADYYVCSWGEALRAALPSGTEVACARFVAPGQQPPFAWTGDAAVRDALVALAESPEAIPEADLPDFEDGVLKPSLIRRLEREGFVEVRLEATPPKVSVKTVKGVALASDLDDSALDGLGEKQRAVLGVLRHLDAPIAQPELLKQSGASSSTVRSLEKRGMVVTTELELNRASSDLQQLISEAPTHALHAGQEKALEQILKAVAAREYAPFLLHGVTGSGKTEVYIEALKQTLALGKTGIVLVPEIALTPQTVRRFRSHFGDRIAVLHSRMSPGERFDAWRALRDGRFQVAIGPRSAILAPLENVGLIVVDEEHEASYKQFDPAPRYHARDVALVRARQAGAVVVLGSATPSLESYSNARSGKYALLRMPDRVPVNGLFPATLPAVRVVDLARERQIYRLRGALSEELASAVALRLERKEQVILLQNRRGYAPIMVCDACGHTPECRDCDVTMTVHRTRRQLRCHYCGRAERMPERCPACGQNAWAELGHGTQRVESELEERFPEARTIRMDLDTTGKRGAHGRLLDAFGRGEADILLGTQMVAKGLDFPNVTLVGVVDADTGLSLPDFRASERTFQLLAQVAGRAGRAGRPGEVVIQTRRPDLPSIQFALQHDFDGFAAAELDDRSGTGYPPFGRMIGIEFKGPEEGKTRALAARWAELLDEVGLPEGADRLGPAAAMIERVQRLWRHHVFIKAPSAIPARALNDSVRRATLAVGSLSRGYRINVVVDPVGMV